MNMPVLAFVTSNTFALVRKVRTLVRVQVGTFAALLAVSESAESIANLSCWIDTNVCKSTFLVCTPPFLEVETGWNVVWGGVVRERTVVASIAIVLEKPALAERQLMWVMEETTGMAGTQTYKGIRCNRKWRDTGASRSVLGYLSM